MVELAPESFVHPPSSASPACCNNERYFAPAGVDGKPDGVRCWENEIYDDVWRFPEMGGPLNHPFDFRIFHSKPSPPFMETSIWKWWWEWWEWDSADSAADFFTSLWHTSTMESHGMEGLFWMTENESIHCHSYGSMGHVMLRLVL